MSDLRSYKIVGNELVVGANNNLTEARKIFEAISETRGFEYCLGLAKHIDQMANLPVRNVCIFLHGIPMRMFSTIAV